MSKFNNDDEEFSNVKFVTIENKEIEAPIIFSNGQLNVYRDSGVSTGDKYTNPMSGEVAYIKDLPENPSNPNQLTIINETHHPHYPSNAPNKPIEKQSSNKIIKFWFKHWKFLITTFISIIVIIVTILIYIDSKPKSKSKIEKKNTTKNIVNKIPHTKLPILLTPID